MNAAQKLLVSIGGSAGLVAGHMGHYWADASTAPKPRKKKTGFGENLRMHFARKNKKEK